MILRISQVTVVVVRKEAMVVVKTLVDMAVKALEVKAPEVMGLGPPAVPYKTTQMIVTPTRAMEYLDQDSREEEETMPLIKTLHRNT